jgi:two-component system, OmpR family, alkaline phosphatase synthesis response regulator PhoP
MASGKPVLIVEDDRDISNLLAINLKGLGLASEIAADGVTGLKKAQAGGYSLIILDLMLPELDGVEVCKGIRKEQPTVPILMLTAKSEELDKVLGLELGADDYVTKPFGIRELMARIKALLRRSEGVSTKSGQFPDETVSVGGITIDFAKRKVTIDGNVVDLTAKEFELLALFVRNPGRAFSRSQLLEQVWGYQFDGYDHTVNSHINRLRNKIEKNPGEPVYLQTVWGVGYRFAEAEELDG